MPRYDMLETQRMCVHTRWAASTEYGLYMKLWIDGRHLNIDMV